MEDLGIYFYNARFYSPSLGRFLSVDTIVSEIGNSQAYDRYAYTENNPIKYIDSSGHGVQLPQCIPGFNCPGDALWSYPSDDFEAFYEIGSAILFSPTLPLLNCSVDINTNQVTANPPSNVILFGADVNLTVPNFNFEVSGSNIRTFYYATTISYEEDFLENGINLNEGRLSLDFNPSNQRGFYMTDEITFRLRYGH